jgi:ClpP class serine protease
VQKNGTLRPYCSMTGYDGIRQAFWFAVNDPEVRAIVLDIDSPSGEVAGCFDLVDAIHAARGTKPIWSILNEAAYSAGYALASAADHITVPRTGGTGSIDVVCCHVDWLRAVDQAGIAVTFIQYGARKTDGAAEKPLADEALARFQYDIDELGELFVAAVARNRGLSANAVRGTQAATCLGQAGVTLGLADTVMAPTPPSASCSTASPDPLTRRHQRADAGARRPALPVPGEAAARRPPHPDLRPQERPQVRGQEGSAR